MIAATAPSIAAFTDDDLLRQVATGDQDAFSELFDRLHGRVTALVTKVLIDRSHSEEVVQEVFLEVWQHAARFDPERGRAISWVQTMAHRRAVDRVRAAQSSRVRDLAVGVRDFRREFDSTYEAVEITVEHQRVQWALDAISPFQRETVVLSYQHGCSLREIADMLQVPIGTIKTRLRDGLIRLRRELAA